jgi:hypothetical protein
MSRNVRGVKSVVRFAGEVVGKSHWDRMQPWKTHQKGTWGPSIVNI